MEKIVAVIAAHDEEREIIETLAILNDFKKKGIIHDILVVNDGSRDRTVEEALAMKAKVVSHRKQSGKRKVFATGVLKAHEMGATTILMLDADILDFPEKTAIAMINAVRDPRKCLMATAQQYEPTTHWDRESSEGRVDDPHSNAQRAINMSAVEPLIRGNKKWIDILQRNTRKKWGLEYALDRLIPKNKKVFLKDSPICTRPAFRAQHKYRIERGGLKDLFFQQRKDRKYVDKVLEKRRKLAKKIKAQKNSPIRNFFRKR